MPHFDPSRVYQMLVAQFATVATASSDYVEPVFIGDNPSKSGACAMLVPPQIVVVSHRADDTQVAEFDLVIAVSIPWQGEAGLSVPNQPSPLALGAQWFAAAGWVASVLEHRSLVQNAGGGEGSRGHIVTIGPPQYQPQADYDAQPTMLGGDVIFRCRATRDAWNGAPDQVSW